jgi:hypothetical protein
MIGHVANVHVVASLLQGSKPAEWNDPQPGRTRCFTAHQCQWMGCFSCRPNEAVQAARRVEI